MTHTTLPHQATAQKTERPYGLFLTEYEVITLRILLKDYVNGKPIHEFDEALALRVSERFLRCPDCGAEHEGLC